MLSCIYVRHFWRALSFWAKNSINLSFPEMIALKIINKFCFHQPKINYFIIIVQTLSICGKYFTPIALSWWKNPILATFHWASYQRKKIYGVLILICNIFDLFGVKMKQNLAVNGQLIFRYRIFTTSDAVKMSDWSLDILISVTEEVWPLKTSNSSVVRKLYR